MKNYLELQIASNGNKTSIMSEMLQNDKVLMYFKVLLLVAYSTNTLNLPFAGRMIELIF